MTKKAMEIQLMDSGLSTKVYKKGNLFIEQLKCDGEGVRDNPETDTGGQGEYPKVSERTMVKELGKMTP